MNGKRTPNRNQVFDSNGPGIRVRGNAQQLVEKYLGLARDAASQGDRVLAENCHQHADHYQRVLNALTGRYNRPDDQAQSSQNASNDVDDDDGQDDDGNWGQGPQPYVQDRSDSRDNRHDDRADESVDDAPMAAGSSSAEEVETETVEEPPPPPKPARRRRAPRTTKAAAAAAAQAAEDGGQQSGGDDTASPAESVPA